MKRLAVALSFLTRLPMPRVEADAADFAAAIRCYPLAGLLIGAIVAGAGWVGALADPWLGALAALVAWVAVTGALHLDGLADMADALGAAHRDPARLLAVMADPHVGTFGTVALVLQLLAKLVVLHALVADPLAIALIPAAARLAPLAWARWLPPLKPGGLGAAVAGAVRARDLLGWTALLALAAVAVPALLATPLLALAFALWVRHCLGGITGDVHGAGIELLETALLVTILVATRLT